MEDIVVPAEVCKTTEDIFDKLIDIGYGLKKISRWRLYTASIILGEDIIKPANGIVEILRKGRILRMTGR